METLLLTGVADFGKKNNIPKLVWDAEVPVRNEKLGRIRTSIESAFIKRGFMELPLTEADGKLWLGHFDVLLVRYCTFCFYTVTYTKYQRWYINNEHQMPPDTKQYSHYLISLAGSMDEYNKIVILGEAIVSTELRHTSLT